MNNIPPRSSNNSNSSGGGFGGGAGGGSNSSGMSGGGPGRFANRNYNSALKAPPVKDSKFPVSSASIPVARPQVGSMVMVGKSRVGKAVGTAAVPAAAPTPLNTPSLKREKGQDVLPSAATTTSGWSSNNNVNNSGISSDVRPPDDGSPQLKSGISAKPAPWAKSDGRSEVTDQQAPEKPAASSRGRTRSWADTDESDEDEHCPQQSTGDRGDRERGDQWPNNFREPPQQMAQDGDYLDDYDQQRQQQRFDPRQRVRQFEGGDFRNRAMEENNRFRQPQAPQQQQSDRDRPQYERYDDYRGSRNFHDDRPQFRNDRYGGGGGRGDNFDRFRSERDFGDDQGSWRRGPANRPPSDAPPRDRSMSGEFGRPNAYPHHERLGFGSVREVDEKQQQRSIIENARYEADLLKTKAMESKSVLDNKIDEEPPVLHIGEEEQPPILDSKFSAEHGDNYQQGSRFGGPSAWDRERRNPHQGAEFGPRSDGWGRRDNFGHEPYGGRGGSTTRGPYNSESRADKAPSWERASALPHESRGRSHSPTGRPAEMFDGAQPRLLSKPQPHHQPPQLLIVQERANRSHEHYDNDNHADSMDGPHDADHLHARPRKMLFDPKSSQYVEPQTSKHSTAPIPDKSRTGITGSKKEKVAEKGPEPDNGKWTKVSLLERKDDVALVKVDDDADRDGKRKPNGPIVSDEQLERAKQMLDRKELRNKERENRGPRTKGLLFRFNSLGEIEEVVTPLPESEKLTVSEAEHKDNDIGDITDLDNKVDNADVVDVTTSNDFHSESLEIVDGATKDKSTVPFESPPASSLSKLGASLPVVKSAWIEPKVTLEAIGGAAFADPIPVDVVKPEPENAPEKEEVKKSDLPVLLPSTPTISPPPEPIVLPTSQGVSNVSLSQNSNSPSLTPQPQVQILPTASIATQPPSAHNLQQQMHQHQLQHGQLHPHAILPPPLTQVSPTHPLQVQNQAQQQLVQAQYQQQQQMYQYLQHQQLQAQQLYAQQQQPQQNQPQHQSLHPQHAHGVHPQQASGQQQSSHPSTTLPGNVQQLAIAQQQHAQQVQQAPHSAYFSDSGIMTAGGHQLHMTPEQLYQQQYMLHMMSNSWPSQQAQQQAGYNTQVASPEAAMRMWQQQQQQQQQPPQIVQQQQQLRGAAGENLVVDQGELHQQSNGHHHMMQGQLQVSGQPTQHHQMQPHLAAHGHNPMASHDMYNRMLAQGYHPNMLTQMYDQSGQWAMSYYPRDPMVYYASQPATGYMAHPHHDPSAHQLLDPSQSAPAYAIYGSTDVGRPVYGAFPNNGPLAHPPPSQANHQIPAQSISSPSHSPQPLHSQANVAGGRPSSTSPANDGEKTVSPPLMDDDSAAQAADLVLRGGSSRPVNSREFRLQGDRTKEEAQFASREFKRFIPQHSNGPNRGNNAMKQQNSQQFSDNSQREELVQIQSPQHIVSQSPSQIGVSMQQQQHLRYSATSEPPSMIPSHHPQMHQIPLQPGNVPSRVNPQQRQSQQPVQVGSSFGEMESQDQRRRSAAPDATLVNDFRQSGGRGGRNGGRSGGGRGGPPAMQEISRGPPSTPGNHQSTYNSGGRGRGYGGSQRPGSRRNDHNEKKSNDGEDLQRTQPITSPSPSGESTVVKESEGK